MKYLAVLIVLLLNNFYYTQDNDSLTSYIIPIPPPITDGVVVLDHPHHECPYTVENAIKDIKQDSLKIVIQIGFTGLEDYNKRRALEFQAQYNVNFDFLGCMRGWDVNEEDTYGYNEIIFKHLVEKHGEYIKQEFDHIWN